MPRNADVAPEVCPLEDWYEAHRLEGWLTREEADLLYRYARSPWAEVGTWKGRSARVLAARGHGYCVDRFEEGNSASEVHTALNGFRYTLFRGDMLKVAHKVPDGLRFLYLDADHSYEGTAAAWREYAPKVAVGGYIAIHDALELHPQEMDWPDVNRFVRDILYDRSLQLVAAAHRVVVVQRTR